MLSEPSRGITGVAADVAGSLGWPPRASPRRPPWAAPQLNAMSVRPQEKVSMMLGLQYGTVNLAASDPTWAQLFRDEKARLCAAGLPPECLVEHVGSTAVPGLAAKPILDIAIGVPVDVAVSDVIAAIERAGYLYRGNAGSEGGHVLVREAAPLLRTHHVHVVGVMDQQWSSYLVLRDWLRSHPEARVAYERAKYQFAVSYSNDRRAYTAAKARLIAELLSVAKSE